VPAVATAIIGGNAADDRRMAGAEHATGELTVRSTIDYGTAKGAAMSGGHMLR
jgi:hypothetical protein